MLNQIEVKKLIGLLDQLGPEQIVYDLQLAVQKKFALTAIETVIINDKGEVLLINRPDNQSEIHEWRGKPHSPGSMLRETDTGFQNAFDRVQNSEIKTKFGDQPKQVETIITKTNRGTETAVIFLCNLAEKPHAGYWLNIDELPKNLLSHHINIISIAHNAWKNQQKVVY